MKRILNTLTLGAAVTAAAVVLSQTGCGGTSESSPAVASGTTAAAVSAAARELRPSDDREEHVRVAELEDLLEQLRELPALAPLFDGFQVPRPVGYDDDEDGLRLVDLLRAVKLTVTDGVLTITNRETGGVIFTAPLSDLASGVLNAANLPGGTAQPPAACTYTYSAWGACTMGVQTRTVASATPAGCTGTPVLTQACTSTPPPPAPATCTAFTYSAWGTCQSNGTQTRTVLASSPAGCTGGSPVTTQSCTYVPPAPATCTSFTYSAWGACQSNGTQTRAVLGSSPSGCTGGSPVTTQSCTYSAPLDGAALYGTYCSRCHGALASSNLKGRNISVASIKARNMTQGLTDAQLQAIVTAVGP